MKRKIPTPLKILLFLFVSLLGILDLRLLPAILSEGRLPTIALLGALGLIIGALINLTRLR
jgi:hypothetical protein